MKLIIWKDKHGDLIYDVSTENKLQEAVMDIIGRRIEGQYFDEEDEIRAKSILDREDISAGLALLRWRDDEDYEYERFVETRTIN